MKKAIALVLASALLLSAALYFPGSAGAQTRSATCYREWNGCRTGAFEQDVSWWKLALILTVCDVGLGRCLLAL
jgi:hypothetical protein